MTYGSIYVGSYPSAASVYMDTVYQGTAPIAISSLTPGNYTILLQMSGYADWSDSIAVTAGNQTTVYQVLSSLVTTTATTVPETTVPTITTPVTTLQTIAHKVTTVKIPTPWPLGKTQSKRPKPIARTRLSKQT